MFVIKSNRSTYHIDGLDIRTSGGGNDTNGHVSYYARSACPVLSRSHRFQIGARYASPAEALRKADLMASVYGNKLCGHCRDAAMVMILDEAHVENADHTVARNADHDITPALGDLLEAASYFKRSVLDDRADNPTKVSPFFRLYSATLAAYAEAAGIELEEAWARVDEAVR